MYWPKTGRFQYHAHIRLSYNVRAMKGLVVNNNWGLKPQVIIYRPLRYKSISITYSLFIYILFIFQSYWHRCFDKLKEINIKDTLGISGTPRCHG